MGQRIAFGLVAIVALVVIFAVDVAVAEHFAGTVGFVASLLSRGSLVPITVVVLLLWGASELARLFRQAGARPHAPLAMAVILLLVLTPWWVAARWGHNEATGADGLDWVAVWFIAGLIAAGLVFVLRGQTNGLTRDLAATIFMMAYLGFLPSFALLMRSDPHRPGQSGAWLLLVVLLLTKVSDIGAYFVGSAVGRHKLAPDISPGKSVEGTAAGLIAAGLFAGFLVVAERWVQPGSDGSMVPRLAHEATRAFTLSFGDAIEPAVGAVIFGIAVAVFAQIGDLIESCFKRDAGLRHSGMMIPHYGGILDLIDSPVVAVPVAWFLLTVVWKSV